MLLSKLILVITYLSMPINAFRSRNTPQGIANHDLVMSSLKKRLILIYDCTECSRKY